MFAILFTETHCTESRLGEIRLRILSFTIYKNICYLSQPTHLPYMSSIF
jgi:hypothetical protein